MHRRIPGRRTTILALTTEVELTRLLRSVLEPRCKVKVMAGEPTSANPSANDEAADIVIVDVETSELSILSEAKRSYPKARIIALFGEYREADCIAALDMDADYLPRPFRARDLAARVRVAELRRFSETARPRFYRRGPLAFDLFKGTLTIDGLPIGLSPSERTVLVRLASKAGTIVTYDRLFAELGLVDSWKSRQTLRSCVFGLRRKIERDAARPEILLAEAGVGYRLAASMDGLPYRGTDPPPGKENWG